MAKKIVVNVNITETPTTQEGSTQTSLRIEPSSAKGKNEITIRTDNKSEENSRLRLAIAKMLGVLSEQDSGASSSTGSHPWAEGRDGELLKQVHTAMRENNSPITMKTFNAVLKIYGKYHSADVENIKGMLKPKKI